MPDGAVSTITKAPLFIDYQGGNLRLESDSPCINAGNNGYAGSTDHDGRPRIVGGTVDMGAYEFQPGVSGEFIGWLQRYSLPTDGSADHSDSDGDGMDNWGEWVCGTEPTEPSSVLSMLLPTPGSLGVQIPWHSVTSRNYFLERATNLALPNPFLPVATSIPGQTGITSFTDTNAPGMGPFFYRVGVKYP
jgi:hypothetical protein